MKNKLKYFLIAIVIIVIIITLMSFTTAKEDAAKKKDIDNIFAIWLSLSGPGDKQTLIQNEVSIKKDLYDKLNSQEIFSLKGYSMALQNLMSVKNTPFDPLFLNSLSYLTINFTAVKQIIGKTNASNIFTNFGFGAVPKTAV